jgi:hypothetical protein
MKTWLVWHVEYPDEGSYEIRAKSHQAAKRVVRSWADEGDEVDADDLRACLLTPELRRVRRENDPGAPPWPGQF